MSYTFEESDLPLGVFIGYNIRLDGGLAFGFLLSTRGGGSVCISCDGIRSLDANALTRLREWVEGEEEAFTTARLLELEHENTERLENNRPLRASKDKLQPAPRPGFIYVVRAEGIRSESGNPLYKIGWAKSIEERLEHFGVVLPFKLTLIHSIPTDDALRSEKTLHITFAPARRDGEWFELSDEDVLVIRSIVRMPL